MKIHKDTPKEEILKISKIECKSCTHCCEYGSGIVLKEEVDEIAKKLKLTKKQFIENYLEEFEKFATKHYRFKTIKQQDKNYGKCIFLTEKGCSIHEIKPLHCKVGTCNENGEDINLWFTLNHFVNQYNPESIRQWAGYIKLGNKTIAGGELKNIVKDEKKLKEILEYKILR